jgi:hypothetical protein
MISLKIVPSQRAAPQLDSFDSAAGSRLNLADFSMFMTRFRHPRTKASCASRKIFLVARNSSCFLMLNTLRKNYLSHIV